MCIVVRFVVHLARRLRRGDAARSSDPHRRPSRTTARRPPAGCPNGTGSTDGWSCDANCTANTCQEGPLDGAAGLQACTVCSGDATCAAGQPYGKCTCSAGFSGNGTTCADVNECTAGTPCDAHATCNNTVGGYTCACNAGYTGNGTTCADPCTPSPCQQGVNQVCRTSSFNGAISGPVNGGAWCGCNQDGDYYWNG